MYTRIIIVTVVSLVHVNCDDYKVPDILYSRNRRQVFDDELRPEELPPHTGYLQEPFPDVVGFPCHLVNIISAEVPTSVHKLRPGDIDVIASIGDSMTVAQGAVATNRAELNDENRGFSFSIGGQWYWRNSTTLPNIFRIFNPNIVGYSYADSYSFYSDSQFNVAEIGATTADLLYMAEILVNRIRDDPRVDYPNHWKMLTISIGGNDICSQICTMENPEEFPEIYRQRLTSTLHFLKNNMPRTFVNLVPVPPLQDVVLLDDKPDRCKILKLLECPCWVGNLYNKTDPQRDLYREIQRKSWQVEKDVAQLFRGDDNFAVVYQPFMEKFSLKLFGGDNDFSLMGFDCFHLSQKGMTWAGTALWNNLLEASGNKTTTWDDPRNKFLCPSEEHPYFHTYDNDNYHVIS